MFSLVKLLVVAIAVFSTTFLVLAAPLDAGTGLIERQDPPPLGGPAQLDHLDQSGEAYGKYRLALAVSDHTQVPPHPPDEK